MASFDDAVGQLRAIAEPTRLRVLRLLREGEFNVKDLAELLGQSQPRVSRHVKLLADAGLIERHQEGSFVFIQASSDAAADAFLAAVFAMIDGGDPRLRRDLDRAAQLRKRRALFVEDYFAKNASRWDQIRSLHVPERDVEAAIASTLGPGLFELLLDLGTGTGRMLELLSSRAKRLVGIDSSPEMLKCARVRLDTAGVSNASVRLGSIYNLPFGDGSADAIVIHQVLHYLETPKAALIEAARVLKPEGRLLLVDFLPHRLEFLRTEHAHVRLGFAKGEIATWLGEAGMHESAVHELGVAADGDRRLTVGLWLALNSRSALRTVPPEWKAA